MVIRVYVFSASANPNPRARACVTVPPHYSAHILFMCPPPLLRSSDIVAHSATDAEALKQWLDVLVASTSSPSVLMPSDIVALPVADTEVLKQWLDALVATTEAAEEKATAVCRCILAARQLLDKEQGAAADLKQ
jgi:hypothetical protein